MRTADLAHAIALAAHEHRRQVDKSGLPFITHPLRMAIRAIERGLPIDVAIVAALHDVLEDTDDTLDGIREVGFEPQIVDAVEALTKRPDEAYESFIRRAASNPLARAVKLLDIEDNSDPQRLCRLDADISERLAAKYASARAILEGA